MLIKTMVSKHFILVPFFSPNPTQHFIDFPLEFPFPAKPFSQLDLYLPALAFSADATALEQ